MKKVAIVGSRDYSTPHLVLRFCKLLNPDTVIISGAARGVDWWAAYSARALGLGLREFPADWDKFGKGAGFMRNKDIVNEADIIVTFWDGKSRGTASTIEIAERAGKKVLQVKEVTDLEKFAREINE